MTAGINKIKHNIILMTKCLPTPSFKSTATGGKNKDKIISINLLSISVLCFCNELLKHNLYYSLFLSDTSDFIAVLLNKKSPIKN